MRCPAWLCALGAVLPLLVPLGCSLRSLEELDELDELEELEESPRCPPEMREITFKDGASFCIDRLETARAEFDEFLSAPPAPDALPVQALSLCGGFTGATPGGGADCSEAYQPGQEPELPMTCVTLCEAAAYCQFRGKRLCGGRGGDALLRPVLQGLQDTEKDEWYRACAGDDVRRYPYGNVDDGSCNVSGPALLPSGASAGCKTEEGVMDLSGNASEWTLICRQRNMERECLVRGGEFLTSDRSLAGCQVATRSVELAVPPLSGVLSQRLPGAGIRCCSD
jgi:formylglycine-generating enzyme required for sulfatase activity